MAWELNTQPVPTVPGAQKVLSSRQWHPQPVGQTSWVRNHSIMWLVWPPWPQVRQKLEEPRTATWQMAHWKVKPLQTAHWVPRTSLRQWLQYTPNSARGTHTHTEGQSVLESQTNSPANSPLHYSKLHQDGRVAGV